MTRWSILGLALGAVLAGCGGAAAPPPAASGPTAAVARQGDDPEVLVYKSPT